MPRCALTARPTRTREKRRTLVAHRVRAPVGVDVMSHKAIAKVLVVLAVLLVSIAAYGFMHTGAYGHLCENFGGKWASVSSTCVTRSCYKDGTCGSWANPVVRCNRLKINDTVAEVYFQLGEPERVDGNQYIWHATKESQDLIVAVIEHEKLKSLMCAT